jgi:signal transduction histidine kinase
MMVSPGMSMSGGGATPPAPGDASDRAHAAVDTLHGAARAVAQEPDARELAQALAQQVTLAMRCEWATVAMIVNDQVHVAATARHGVGITSEQPNDSQRALIEWVAQRRQLYSGNDGATLIAGAGVALEEFGARQVVVAPALHHQGQAVAVLLAANRRLGSGFGPLDVRLLETIAQQSVVGFDRAILLDQLGEWTRGMEALLAFSAAVNQQRDPATLVRDMVEHTARFLNAEGGRAGLAERDEETHDLVMVSHARWRHGAWHDAPRRWPRQAGIPGYVLENEFPYLAGEYPDDRLSDQELRAEVRYALCVPIKNSEHAVLGFFELYRGEGGQPFTWHDAAFLESLANTTAVAIENARLVGALAAKHEEIRTLSAHHVNRLEAERQHIARELHDEAGQALVGVKLALQAMAHTVPDTLPAIKEPLAQLRHEVNQATARLRTLARRLRPPTLDQLGLHAALQQLAQEAGDRSGFVVALDLASLPSRLAPDMETALFRITQEALTNAANHAEATQVEISLGICERMLYLRIHDDGCGFDPSAASGGLGLLGIRERVGMLGGEFAVKSAPGQGATLLVKVPPR